MDDYRKVAEGYKELSVKQWELGIHLVMTGLNLLPPGQARDLLHIKMVEALREAKEVMKNDKQSNTNR